jgi:hypothetical protein
MGAAQARAGHLTEAIATMQTALTLARSQEQTALAEKIEAQLAQWRAGPAQVPERPAPRE